ncbi:hypothetical protein VTL71DRAFT_13873 [Oculimacula yallundae]|uniref:Peptidase S54 rhomboid domain-containing protein n=1 Tax=Oculimacula yallundae TaxID=86028 RepID=A0ABR4CMW2_9HELO
MFRSRVFRSLSRRPNVLQKVAQSPGGARRSYASEEFERHPRVPSVRSLGPTVWVLTASGVIYLGCAAYEVRQDIEATKKRSYGPVTYPKIDESRQREGQRQQLRTQTFSLYNVFSTPWANFNSAELALLASVGINTSIFAIASAYPTASAFFFFAHVPASARNFTLFTSMFGHGSLLHLGLNMYAITNFGPPVAACPTFNSSGAHLTAFYLSAGLFASLAQHLNAVWPNVASRTVPSLGASGAVFAMIGVFATEYPDAGMGIILIPGSLPASQMLLGLVAFETWGSFIGFGNYFRWGHAAHLGGALMGIGYVAFNGKDRLWQPAKRLAFNGMRSVGLV